MRTILLALILIPLMSKSSSVTAPTLAPVPVLQERQKGL